MARTGQAADPRMMAMIWALALLIGLALADRHAEAVLGFLRVGHVQGEQLGTAEGTGEAKQEDCAIAAPPKRVGVAWAMARTVSAMIGALRALAAPTDRRMPRTVARTASESVGRLSQPRSLWA